LCKEFIIEVFNELDEQDYFGLYVRLDSTTAQNEETMDV